MLRPIVTTLILIPALGAATAMGQQAPRIDTSGLVHFWRIADMLAEGREPADTVWDAMWSTPGYATLERREGRRALLTTAMRLALDPARATAADSAMASQRWLGAVIPHLRSAARQKDTLHLVEQSLGSPAMFAMAVRRAQAFLPAGTTERLPLPEISLIYFLDARGYQRILFDPLYLMLLDDPTLVLGHELHHYYGNQLGPETKPFGDDMIAWRLATTETEGIAGLVDKRHVPGMSKAELARRYREPRRLEYFEAYQEDYERSNQWLAWVDDILRRVGAHPDSTIALGRILDAALPDNGRIMGAYMAEVIDDQLGRERLLRCVSHPWLFWTTYNEAARQSSGAAFVLSDAAIRAIAEVERRYAVSPRSR